MMIDFPETQTVSSRLTVKDYRAFRALCSASGFTMHKVIRLLVGWWIVEKSREFRMPVRLSDRLARSVEIERERADTMFPVAARASAILSAIEQMSDTAAKSIR